MMMITADSTCDMGNELKEKYNVTYFPFAIHLHGKEYRDGVDLTPDQIYANYNKNKELPKTAATNDQGYIDFFKPFVDQGWEVIHFNIGSGLSASYDSACRAAAALGGKVYPIDSRNLSTGIALQIIEAAARMEQGMSAKQIQQEINGLRTKVHSSFIIDTLEFLHAGGRCSTLAYLGTNLLNIHPCIEVDSTSGSMVVGKKHIGSLDKCLRQYARDKMKQYEKDIRTDKVFITHSGVSEERIALVKDMVEKAFDFDNIYVTRAGCTISTHCGPNTLGVLFMTK